MEDFEQIGIPEVKMKRVSRKEVKVGVFQDKPKVM